MRVRHLAGLMLVTALAFPAAAASPVPRESPDFAIVDPAGSTTSLASLKGQVVVVEFLLMRCAGCLRLAQTINKLYGEMGGRGFRPVGIVFDDGVGGPAVNSFVQLLKIDYPVGYSTSGEVDRYLGRAAGDRFQVPQMVVIDREGVIRAQSLPTGEADLTDETYLRNLVRWLLEESAPPPPQGPPPGKTGKPDVPPRPAG